MILAIDTSTRTISLALRDDHELLAERTWRTAGTHTVELTAAIADLLAGAGVETADLHGIGVAIGPGSFTGLRIGLAVAKGIALASGGRIKLVGVPTLEITAEGQPHLEGIDQLCAVAQAGRGRVSAAFFRRTEGGWQGVGEPFIAAWPELAGRLKQPTLVSGEIDAAGLAALSEAGGGRIADAALRLRRAGYLAEIAVRRLASGKIDSPSTLAPLYLH